MIDTLTDFLAEQKARVDDLLQQMLPEPSPPFQKLHDAMRYSLLGPGKRIRPVLCLTTGEALGAEPADLEPVAAALEMIHTYSLVHDDLPAMDDDNQRRGRPTSHLVFGEAMAILCGDGLLTLAFEVVADKTASTDLVAPLVSELARGAGVGGMVGGQAADLLCEGRAPDAEALRFVHRHKTAALLQSSVVCGALAARANDATLARIRDYGEAIGLAFQVADDILDVTGDARAMGKAVGKDAAIGKLTYPGVHGLEKARSIARSLCERAHVAVEGLPGSQRLTELASFIVERSR